MIRRKGFSLALLLLAGAATVFAQIPDKFTNLRVLPKDTPKAELQSTMRTFAFALNVRCPYCHVEKQDKTIDFAADDKDAKKTARVMMQMVTTINHDYIATIGKPSPVHVECVTCHHGITQPRPLNRVLAETIGTQGIAAGLNLYHDLRSKYYGTGAYDFSEVPLNQLTESLLSGKKNKEAVAIMEMNFASNNPQSIWAYHMLAMAHQANGELEKAKEDYRKVFELHPDDTWAKQQLDSLSAAH
ncbi:MAG TPA: c-type cytochrome [Terracidiphilus sp.]|jgi:tetratricopeptide (TPR) repeat protein